MNIALLQEHCGFYGLHMLYGFVGGELLPTAVLAREVGSLMPLFVMA